jgi:hypothetical protein
MCCVLQHLSGKNNLVVPFSAALVQPHKQTAFDRRSSDTLWRALSLVSQSVLYCNALNTASESCKIHSLDSGI